MKKVLILVMLLIVSKPVIATGNWIYDFENAKKMAIATNKLIFVDFTASWCGPCKKMERESWSDEEVKKMMGNYIPVQIDIDSNRTLAQKYGVRGIPNIFVLDANGKIIFQEMSYKTKSQVLKLLDKYALNTQFLQNAYTFYYKKKTLTTAFRLATKIQDYSLYLKGDLRRIYLNLGKEYIYKVEKLAKRAESPLKLSVNKKIVFLKIQEVLYKGKYKKALKSLAKIEVEKLDEYSYAQYCYLQCIAFKSANDEKNEQMWAQKLNETGKEVAYKKKMELLFS